ncbi:MAG: PPOX class F420-dependent oxidoreductase [Anaerolineales bacterium]|nr:PPOX class F420-dependent oxidoreductase [Anaerolineales bacterium]
MDNPIPKGYEDLLAPERRAVACLALALSDGTPQATPVWFDWGGECIVINTARGRVKDRVLRRRPAVALLIIDPANPYRYLQIKGPAVYEAEEGAYEQICDLQLKYRGDRNYPKRPGETRVVYKIRPERSQARG